MEYVNAPVLAASALTNDGEAIEERVNNTSNSSTGDNTPENNLDDSIFSLIKSDVQIGDDYNIENAYMSEVPISDPAWFARTNGESDSVQGNLARADQMVLLVQKWLNQEYGDVPGFGSVAEDGYTGWDTVYGLLRALQHELGITSLANSFGPSTSSLYQQNLLYRQDGVTDRKFAILQGALWCKGYSPGYHLYETEDGTVVFDGVFDEGVERAIIQLKEDAGFINPNGVVTLNVMKALMSMDSFKLLSSYGGTAEVRAMQQKLNRKYEAYTGLTPCDGVYGRNTNQALILALQAEELMPISVANGNFGNTTKLCCPQIPYVRNSSSARTYPGTSAGSYYTASQISAITELLQFSLLVNGFGDGVIDGVFDSEMQQDIRNFQKEMAIPVTGKADTSTWMSLFVSRGDTSRSALAADCATILTEAKAETLYNNGYRYVGRYLTGTYNGGISKAITREEAQIIFDAGLRFFPIYQTSANYLGYFTSQQGATDAQKATKAATALGLPENTIIYFAVDFDCLDYQITSNVIPYFKRVHEEMADSGYRVGIYGTRNACTRVSNLGYACSSFVGDMSTGFSGNLGFGMPDNWAFDQFATITIGSGDGRIEIDKDGYSGRDPAVSKLNPINCEITSEDINVGNSASDKITGPTVNILGFEVPLFEFDVGLDANGLVELDTEYDHTDNTYKVLIGFNKGSLSTETTGGSTRIGKFKEYYREVKTTFTAIGRNDEEFSRRFKDFKGSLYQRGTKVGFECDAYVFGFMKISGDTGKLIEGGLAVVGTVEHSISYLLVPCVYAKFAIEGSMQSGFRLEKVDTGEIELKGVMEFGVKPKLSVGVDILISSAYAGISGSLDCEIKFPAESFEKSFSAELSASVFFEYQALCWGNNYEWVFANTQLYPTTNTASVMSIQNDDLKFIEPLPQLYSVSNTNTPGVLSSNVQVYCNPKLVSLGNGKMLLTYIADVSDRTAVNRTVLMYRIYDGSSWSIEQPILDDATADFEPYVYADGNGGAHIIWQNCNSVLGSNISFDEMAAAMDLYYTYWNGTSFVNTTAITTNNTNYEMAHKVIASNGNIAVIWQQNSENDAFAIEGTNSIYRKQFVNGAWQNTELIANGLSVVTSMDTAYADGNNVIAYTTKTNSDSSDISDLEVFYWNGTETIRLTNDTTPDYAVSLLNNELYWISGNSVVCITNGNMETKSIVVSELTSNVNRIKVLNNADGKKAVIWQQEGDSEVNFYGVNYNETTNSFGTIEPISTDSGLIRGWDACMLPNGQVELTYGFAERLEESVNGKPYGQIDLLQKTANKYYDVYVDPIISYSGVVEPNKIINVHANVYNNGSMNVNQFTANIVNADNTIIQTYTIDYDLAVGESTELEIPVTLPANIEKTSYTIQIYPTGQTDVFVSDNQAILTIGYADIAIKDIQESRTENGRTLAVVVKNNGFSTVNSATLKFFKEAEERSLIETETIIQLAPGDEETFTFVINASEFDSDVSEQARVYYLLVETEELESDSGNNGEFVYLYPDYDITLTAGAGGSVSGGGTYIKGNSAILIATPASGYIFDGWYENGEMLYGVSNEYEITIDSNRTLEARFKENDLQILDIEIFGTLAVGENISFTASATGGIQPWQWEFYIQKDNESVYSDNAAIVNFFEWSPTQAGTYDVLAFVTDATGKRVSYTTQVVIS